MVKSKPHDTFLAGDPSSPRSGEVLFVRILTQESIGKLLKDGYDLSRDQHSRTVKHMLGSLKLESLMDREFVCTYAFTTNTWKAFRPKVTSMSEGLCVAVVLDVEKMLTGGELLIFNGDIQNLAAKTSQDWWFQLFQGDAQTLANDLDLMVAADPLRPKPRLFSQVAEARFYSRLVPDQIRCVHHCGRTDDVQAIGLAKQLAALCAGTSSKHDSEVEV